MQLSEVKARPAVVLLDVYETLLDMTVIEKRVNQILDNKRGYFIWFELFMQYCFVDNSIVQFNDFASIAYATMQMAGRTLGEEIDEHDINEVLELLKHLPVHEGVQEGLSQLNDAGFRIAALTNSPERTVTERMERTGLISYFEKVMSAEHVRKYKPSLEVYEWAIAKLNVQPGEVLLVSAHGWDLAGAVNAGMQTAYLKQPKQMLYPLAPKPDYICTSITDLAGQLKAVHS
ncbi:haloacid dehalogenase type II [Niastella populi]|uniref:Haloacid dehalogenase, type II n=1 Tax=Niastella populi TaxID=550983 RepID=A0A1V9EVV8_9BACT|nr:haloacid dehalogenase type II [Niastella populi]OQP50269.1 haloacid dehalogenase, type II [Niastella populi]